MKKNKNIIIENELKTLEENSKVLRGLLFKALKEKNYAKSIWLFYSIFENILIRFIVIKMQIKNLKASTPKEPYSDDFINKALRLNKIEIIIKTFCLLYGDNVYADLKKIQEERNKVQHKLLKTKGLTEQKINDTLKEFFVKARPELFFEKMDFIMGSVERDIKEIKKTIGKGRRGLDTTI